MIADALWNDIARALHACYPDRAAEMLRALEKDRNVADVRVSRRVDLIMEGGLRGTFLVAASELTENRGTHGVAVVLRLESVSMITRAAGWSDE